MTRVRFVERPTITQGSELLGDETLTFELLAAPADKKRHLNALRMLTDIPEEEFSDIGIPGSKVYKNRAEGEARISKIQSAERRNRAGAYLVLLSDNPVGLVSYSYPDPAPYKIGKRINQLLIPSHNTTRDFAGWLRRDLLEQTPVRVARAVMRASVEVAQQAGIRQLGVSVAPELEKTPFTKHLVSVESQARHEEFIYLHDHPVQRTEGVEYPGRSYVRVLGETA